MIEHKLPHISSKQMIEILNSWWLRKKPLKNKEIITQQDNTHGYIVFTCYPYFYRKSCCKDMTLQEIMNHRVMYIPNLKEHSADTIKVYRKVLSMDDKAHYVCLLKLLNIDFNNDTEMLNLMGKLISRPLPTTMCNKQILYNIRYKNWQTFHQLLFNHVETIRRRYKQRSEYIHYFLMKKLYNYNNTRLDRILYSTLPLKIILHMRVGITVCELKEFMQLNFLHGTIKNQLQGKNSQMRRKILSPKIVAIRCQIGLRYDLNSDSIVLPISLLNKLKIMLNLKDIELFDLTTSAVNQDHKLIDLSINFSCIIKRDPVISKNSVVCIKKIGFANTDNMYISPYILHGQNADFDGDAEHVNLIFDLKSSLETKMLMLPNYNIYNSFLSLRLVFSETHIIYMHNNRELMKQIFAEACGERKDAIVDEIYNIELLDWFCNQDNIEHVNVFFEKYASLFTASKEELFNYIEPTLIILNKCALLIYLLYGNRACHNFFILVNKNVLIKSQRHSYILTNRGLHCDLLFRIAVCGAKGSLHHYNQLLGLHATAQLGNQALYENNGQKIYNTINETMQDIGKTVQQVPKLGHQSFKSLIEWNGIELINNKVYYENNVILNDLNNLCFDCQILDKTLSLSLFNLISNGN